MPQRARRGEGLGNDASRRVDPAERPEGEPEVKPACNLGLRGESVRERDLLFARTLPQGTRQRPRTLEGIYGEHRRARDHLGHGE